MHVQGINAVEELDYKRVAHFLDPYLSFLSNLMCRGLYLLFIASLIMTSSHSFLLFSGALTMTVAFLYMLLWMLRLYVCVSVRSCVRVCVCVCVCACVCVLRSLAAFNKTWMGG
jgi:hypothetical protein